MDHHKIRRLARCERADALQLAEELSAVRRGDVNGLDGREAGINQQLDFALVAESGDDAAIPSWVESCEQQRSEEHTSELQSLAYLVCRLLLEKKKKAHV